MRIGYRYRRALRFAETDMAGVGHFASLLTLVEEAWHAWLGELGESVHPAHSPAGAEPVGWPVISVECDFHRPLHFGAALVVVLSIARLGTRSITLGFTLEDVGESQAAQGTLAVVCAEWHPDGTWASRPIPATLSAKLSTLP